MHSIVYSYCIFHILVKLQHMQMVEKWASQCPSRTKKKNPSLSLLFREQFRDLHQSPTADLYVYVFSDISIIMNNDPWIETSKHIKQLAC